MLLCSVLFAVTFVIKIPEQYAPGKFDVIFQSHQLFHIMASIAMTAHMKLLVEEEKRV